MTSVVKGNASYDDGTSVRSTSDETYNDIRNNEGTSGIENSLNLYLRAHNANNSRFDEMRIGFLAFDLSSLANLKIAYLFLKCSAKSITSMASTMSIIQSSRVNLAAVNASDHNSATGSFLFESFDMNALAVDSYCRIRLNDNAFRNRVDQDYLSLMMYQEFNAAFWNASEVSEASFYSRTSSGNEPYLLVKTGSGSQHKILSGVGRGIY